jgi:hypothetical protein
MKKLFGLSLLLVLGAAVTGCSKTAVTGPETTGVEAAAAKSAQASTNDADWLWRKRRGTANILFVHASPDAPAVDVYAGWQRVARRLMFPYNTPYITTLARDTRIRINVAGTRTTVIDATVPLERGKYYSAFAVNEVAKIEPLLLEDDLSNPAAGQAHVRFVHLSPNAPAVDIAVTGGPVVFPNTSFKGYTPFAPVPGGTYNLEVRPAGSTDVVLALPNVTLEAGKIYTVFAKGLLGGTGDQALGAQIIVNSDLKPRMIAGGDRGNDDDDDGGDDDDE